MLALSVLSPFEVFIRGTESSHPSRLVQVSRPSWGSQADPSSSPCRRYAPSAGSSRRACCGHHRRLAHAHAGAGSDVRAAYSRACRRARRRVGGIWANDKAPTRSRSHGFPRGARRASVRECACGCLPLPAGSLRGATRRPGRAGCVPAPSRLTSPIMMLKGASGPSLQIRVVPSEYAARFTTWISAPAHHGPGGAPRSL